MTIATPGLPFGLRDVKIRPLDSAGAVGAAIDLPNARTFSFSEAEDFEELRGDDGVVAVRGLGSSVDWELESGGMPLEAIAAMYGGLVATTGTSPNLIKTFTKNETDARPYFQIEGQAISDSGGDVKVLLYKCRATGELAGELADGAFWLTGASGRAIGRASGDRRLYVMAHYQTVTAIPSLPTL